MQYELQVTRLSTKWYFKKWKRREKCGPRISCISITCEAPPGFWCNRAVRGLPWWFLWPLRLKTYWSRLWVNRDKDNNPSGHALQACCTRNHYFFLPDPLMASVHVIIPSESRQLLQQWICFLQTRGCHSPDLPPVSHPIRFCGGGTAHVTDRHTSGQKLERTGLSQSKTQKGSKFQFF